MVSEKLQRKLFKRLSVGWLQNESMMMINTWSSHSLAVFFCICTASLFPQRVYFPFPEGHFPFLSKLMSLSTKRSKQTMPFLFSALISLPIIDMFSCFTFGSGWHGMLFLYTQGVLNPLLAHSCVFALYNGFCVLKALAFVNWKKLDNLIQINLIMYICIYVR